VQLFKGRAATLDRMRSDRWLEEALSHGPDPLHLSTVLGISTSAAMRYAQAANQSWEASLLTTLEESIPRPPAKIVTMGDRPWI
jgi:hypothetical protein